MEISALGIDLGKNGCSLVGLDGSGRVIMRRRKGSSFPMIRSSTQSARGSWRSRPSGDCPRFTASATTSDRAG